MLLSFDGCWVAWSDTLGRAKSPFEISRARYCELGVAADMLAVGDYVAPQNLGPWATRAPGHNLTKW